MTQKKVESMYLNCCNITRCGEILKMVVDVYNLKELKRKVLLHYLLNGIMLTD